MSAYLVTVVVTDPDDATARALAQTIADLAAQESERQHGRRRNLRWRPDPGGAAVTCPTCGHSPEQAGLLIDGAEFVPLDIVRDHLPFAASPGVDVRAVWFLDAAPVVSDPTAGTGQ